MHRLSRLVSCITLLAILLTSIPTMAQETDVILSERITDFTADITIAQNGTVRVKETIIAVAQGNQIRRGIYRDFPLMGGFLWQNPRGFKVVQVLKDGQNEPYHTSNVNDGIRVYFGEEDVFLDPGTYTYTFVYETTNQLGYFEDYDELYWNVTGNNWSFPIEEASFTLHLPPGATTDAVQAKAFVGPNGSTEQAETIVISPENDSSLVSGSSPRRLLPGEGITLAVNWPKGLVPAPFTTGNQWLDLFVNLPSVLGLVLVIGILVAYTGIWLREGRDRKTKQPVVVSFEPPENVSPAMVRYIDTMGMLDSITYTTIVLHLAIKGYLIINKDDDTYVVYRTGKEPVEMSDDERIVYTTFFGTAPYPDPVKPPPPGAKETIGEKIRETFLGPDQQPGVFAIHRKNQIALKSMQTQLDAYFNKEKKKYIIPNYRFLTGGFLAIVLFVAFNFSYSIIQGYSSKMFFLLFATFWVGIVSIFLYVVMTLWQHVIQNGRGWGAAIFLSLFLTPFVVVGLGTSAVAYGIGGGIAFIVSVVAMCIYTLILSRRTPEGLAIQDKIEGFLLFVKGQERYMQKIHKSIPEKFSMYEKYLPYAIALDVEPLWSEEFKDTIKKMEDQGRSTGSVHSWYAGSSVSHGMFGSSSFASSFTNSFSTSMSSGSSSGSSGGGGGSSGGGGW